MNKILNTNEAIKVAKQLRKEGKSVVLAGGCFDILHPGHVLFLQEAKKQGDILFVLLESDDMIRKKKGKDRPIHTQKDRSLILESLTMVDYIIPLPLLYTDQNYDNLLSSLKPTIIATTKGDANRHHKERQAKLINAQVVEVIQRIEYTSTTMLAKTLKL